MKKVTRGDIKQYNYEKLVSFIADLEKVCSAHGLALYGQEDEYGNEMFMDVQIVKKNGQIGGYLGSIISIEPGDDAEDCVDGVSSTLPEEH